MYSFATLKDHKLSEANDNDPDSYDEVLALREKNPDLQVLLAIGGWAFGSTPFKELTSNVFRMNQFVYEAIEFLREYQFNGLDGRTCCMIFDDLTNLSTNSRLGISTWRR